MGVKFGLLKVIKTAHFRLKGALMIDLFYLILVRTWIIGVDFPIFAVPFLRGVTNSITTYGTSLS
ncbi:MAG TPA: hypothetical protein PLJ08_02185, partial [Cyclobacteriaceae bacterium]|nr:hypothetical protein [Cyclobacteriaceae bacterium]